MKEILNLANNNSKSELIDQFGERAKTFNNSAAWITDENLLLNISRLVEKAPGTKGIELCCGTGVVSRVLKNLNGLDMTGVDITPSMLKESGKHMNVIQANVENLPFEDNSIDFIVIRQALFLTDSVKVLENVRRVLKPGGQFIVINTVPISEYDNEYLKEVHTVKQKELKKFYTAHSLEEEIRESGLIVCKSKFLTIRESINRWMDTKYAPELSNDKRQKVLDMIQNSPKDYSETRKLIITKDGQTTEDWGWQIFSATKSNRVNL